MSDTSQSGADLQDVVVIGAGQAGLCLSYHLCRHGLAHTVFEQRGSVAGSWHDRWDSFTQLTPNIVTMVLPGLRYDHEPTGTGPIPKFGFMTRDETIAYLERFARTFPFAEHARFNRRAVKISRVVRDRVECYAVSTQPTAGGASETGYFRNVVLATGMCQAPRLPALAATVPVHITQMHSRDYRNPSQIREGAVLIVGAGQTGSQVAKELAESGRRVYLSTGTLRCLPRTMYGRDVTEWMIDLGLFNRSGSGLLVSAADEPYPENPYIAEDEFPGERELFPPGVNIIEVARNHPGTVTLLGRALKCDGRFFHFDAPALPRVLRESMAFVALLDRAVRAYCRDRGLVLAPAPADDPHFDVEAAISELPLVAELPCEGVATVIYCSGYSHDFQRLLDLEPCWTERLYNPQGYPVQPQGISAVPGLYFCGLHYEHLPTRTIIFYAAMLLGVSEAAELIVEHIAARRAV
jgi:putative flavoprotein involved in K+ transport